MKEPRSISGGWPVQDGDTGRTRRRPCEVPREPEILWHGHCGQSPYPSRATLLASHSAVAVSCADWVAVLDMLRGECRWTANWPTRRDHGLKRPQEYQRPELALMDSGLLVWSGGGVSLLKLETGELIYQHPLQDGVEPILLCPDRRLAIGAIHGNKPVLVAYKLPKAEANEVPTLLWSSPLPAPVSYQFPGALVGDTLFVSTAIPPRNPWQPPRQCRLRAFLADTGQPTWEAEFGAYSVAGDPGGLVVNERRHPPRVILLDVTGGAQKELPPDTACWLVTPEFALVSEGAQLHLQSRAAPGFASTSVSANCRMYAPTAFAAGRSALLFQANEGDQRMLSCVGLTGQRWWDFPLIGHQQVAGLILAMERVLVLFLGANEKWSAAASPK